jgi:hypothetical protein
MSDLIETAGARRSAEWHASLRGNEPPAQQSFFVTVRLRDSAGRTEIVFLAVDSIARDSVYGRLWNPVELVREYKERDPYAVSEGELLDWLITRPDGTEEGNVVGKFIDTYHP